MATTDGNGSLNEYRAHETEVLRQLHEEVEAEGDGDSHAGTDDQAGGQSQAAAPAAAQAAAPAAPAPSPAPAAPAAPAAAPAAEAKAGEGQAAADSQQPPQGDLKAALRASRHAERRAKQEADRLRQENEDLKAGKTKPEVQISDEDLALLEADQPLQAQIIRTQRRQEAELAELRAPKPEANEFVPRTYDDPTVQDAIDSVPALVAWQHDPDAQHLFDAAIEHDKKLKLLPEWKDKPLAARLAEVAKSVLKDSAPEPRQDPAAVIAAAPAAAPSQISDFKGGALPNANPPNYSKMSDADIMAHLARE